MSGDSSHLISIYGPNGQTIPCHDAKVFNAQLVRLASHYRFNTATAAPNDPETRGKVEALVKFVKANLPADGFGSLTDANQWAYRWNNGRHIKRYVGKTLREPAAATDAARTRQLPTSEEVVVTASSGRRASKTGGSSPQ